MSTDLTSRFANALAPVSFQFEPRVFSLALVLACLVGWPSVSEAATLPQNAETVPDAAQDEIELPAEQKTPVFVLNRSGGFRRGPKVGVDFQLFADGRLLALVDREVKEFQLSKQELQSFLKFVIQEQQLYEHRNDELEAEMAKQGRLPKDQIADANTTEFKLDLPRGQHEVSVYALFLARRQFEDVEGLTQLSAIDDRCSNLVAVRSLGDQADEILKQVNEQLKAQSLPVEPVKKSEVRSVSRSGNGRFQVSFRRPQPNADNERNPELNIVYFKKDANTPAKVTVYGLQRE